MKKIIYIFLIVIMILPTIIYASVGSLVKVGNNYYETLEEAILNVTSNETISLISDVKLREPLEINKTININLNNHDIEGPEKVFIVQGGTLNLTGKGTIKETNPNYGAIIIKGSQNPNDNNYSVVNIDKDITLEGWSGLFITHNNNHSYGIEVNFAGNINAVNDTSGGTGIGIYVNGNIKDKTNSPIITILDNANIKSTGNGLYLAGYGTYNINESTIQGVESGIGIKSGILNIDGAKVIGTGPDKTPTEGYNNGIKASGTAIQIESNNGYTGDVELNIDSGTFISNNSHTIYEYIGKGHGSQVIALDISGGTYQSPSNKSNFLLSNSLKEYHNNFISGGKYSKDPSNHLKPGYSIANNNNTYEVVASTMKYTNNQDISKENNPLKIIIIIIIITSLIVTILLNKTKILNHLTK